MGKYNFHILKSEYLLEKYSQSYRTPFLKKFWEFLDSVRREEHIYFKMHNTIESLNAEDISKNPSYNNFACGRYTHLKKEFDTATKRQQHKLPLIELVKDSYKDKATYGLFSNVWVYAHELGHHFAIKTENDCSEIAANRWIEKLARQCFDEYEFAILEIPISVHSNDVSNKNDRMLEKFAKNHAIEKIKESREKLDKEFMWGLGIHFRTVLNLINKKQETIDFMI